MPEYKAVDKLFYSFHSEFEAIIMDMIGEKTDKRIIDTMFEDFDRLVRLSRATSSTAAVQWLLLRTALT